jgi:CBS domain-containing protein
MNGTLARAEGSYLSPSFERARVVDVMHPGVITCSAETSVEEVARIMVTNHVHAVVVVGLADGEAWGVISATDVLGVASEAPDRLVGTCAGTELVTVAPQDPLRVAAGVMREHEVSHLLVVDPERGLPVGVLSTLDVMGAIAWGCA